VADPAADLSHFRRALATLRMLAGAPARARRRRVGTERGYRPIVIGLRPSSTCRPSKRRYRTLSVRPRADRPVSARASQRTSWPGRPCRCACRPGSSSTRERLLPPSRKVAGCPVFHVTVTQN